MVEQAIRDEAHGPQVPHDKTHRSSKNIQRGASGTMLAHTRLTSFLRTLTMTSAIALATILPGGSALAQGVMGGEVVVVQGSNPPSLDAMATSSGASRNINMNVYETLYGFDEN